MDDDFYWHQLSAAQYGYIKSPVNFERCTFCKRGTSHKMHPVPCAAVVFMPFGKHKGKPLTDVPDSYKLFLLEKNYGTKELRARVRESLGIIPLPEHDEEQ